MPQKMVKKKKEIKNLKFDQKLVLNQWMLSLFNVDSIEKLAEDGLKSPDAEGVDEHNISYFHKILTATTIKDRLVTDEDLLRYDENIMKHTRRINEKRQIQIRWKYFQYLALLFTEIYLDRYFADAQKLMSDLNEFVDMFNGGLSEQGNKADAIDKYSLKDLNKLAFWNATGSGKTLIMHINMLQYLHYLEKAGRERELDRIILLTPNEGLSAQHLAELKESGLEAELFEKERDNRKLIQIIDIHKLKDDSGEKTVAVDSFEGQNLVMVDEGHRGSSGMEWKAKRDKLCEDGFSFEYSATFGQAMKASKKKELIQEYARCILFDYSYKFFYKDGYGKDYRIFNMSDDSNNEHRKRYLSACLLSFYQQQKIYTDNIEPFRPFLLERPLWVFVGGSVNAVRTEHKREISDVMDILIFLAEFVNNRRESVECIRMLLSDEPYFRDTAGKEVFNNTFTYLIKLKLSADQLFDDVLKTLFNSMTGGKLHMENLKGVGGEIALRVGENEPFGLINVGDDEKLCKLCENLTELVVTKKEFAKTLFAGINKPDSSINLLIGSKKFTEGWNSWRVSTMGLMNVGKQEGSEIIQLFGRGVRLKGYNHCLKRSTRNGIERPPKFINIIETLNIFGVRADYMQQFKDYLEEEGLPSNENREEIILPVIKTLGDKKLKVLALNRDGDFRRKGPKVNLDYDAEYFRRKAVVVVDWYPRIEMRVSSGVKQSGFQNDKHEGRLEKKHLAFMNFDRIYTELQDFKNERGWYKFNLSRDRMKALIEQGGWYQLLIPESELEFDSFKKVRAWEDIAIALLKKFCDSHYKYIKAKWESKFLEYRDLDEEHSLFPESYKVLVDESMDDEILKLKEIVDLIEKGSFTGLEFKYINAILFDRHLYYPLLYVGDKSIEVSPVALNKGEMDFVVDLKKYYEKNKSFFEHRSLYLLRNQTRGKGIGFFQEGNFYPDFILWLVMDGKQYITFVDPKGIKLLEGFSDPKLSFNKKIKEIEAMIRDKYADNEVALSSIIVSNTAYEEVSYWGYSKEEMEEKNVVFQKDTDYIKKIFDIIINSANDQIALESK